MKKDCTHIIIYRKIFGIWFKYDTVYRPFIQDSMEFFRNTRDSYSLVLGKENIRLCVKWEQEYYDGIGKRIT